MYSNTKLGSVWENYLKIYELIFNIQFHYIFNDSFLQAVIYFYRSLIEFEHRISNHLKCIQVYRIQIKATCINFWRRKWIVLYNMDLKEIWNFIILFILNKKTRCFSLFVLYKWRGNYVKYWNIIHQSWGLAPDVT